ncbi:MAG: ribosome silencing factor [Ruminococcaceae bacterium]|nr:ribosome silencing factor [Oscillospiraceae bacterium]
MKYEELIKNIVKALDEKKAEDIKIIETAELTIVADSFIVASGTSSTHVKALADEVEYAISQLGTEPEHIEGRATGWILVDYGTVVVHIFDRQSREYYNIERLWQDANIKTAEDILG